MGQVPMDCLGNDPCFQDLDQNGGTNYCGSNTGWELETMLDVEWAHAMAPYANIMLVEGCTNSFNDLATAVTTAVSLRSEERRVGKECRARWSPASSSPRH